MVKVWSRRGGIRHLIPVPLFRGYVFWRVAVSKFSYLEVVRTPGVVKILGERWDRLATLKDSEIDALRRVVTANAPLLPHEYLRDGRRVRIVSGPLRGVEGR
jgi:transcription antitermination factor NusG